MKFEEETYWKHVRNVDAFIRVCTCEEAPNGGAVLRANWMIQGNESYWFASSREFFFISPKDVDDWKPFEPKGPLKLA